MNLVGAKEKRGSGEKEVTLSSKGDVGSLNPRAEDYESREHTAISDGQKQIPNYLTSRHKSFKGSFCVLTESRFHPDSYKVTTEDGAGTKLFLAQWLNNYQTIGFDLVAMNANDYAIMGKVCPDTINLYFACQSKIEEHKMGEIMKGIVGALKKCDVSDILDDAEVINFGKLETASLDEMITGPVPHYGFDIGCGMNGFIKKDDMPLWIPKKGDIIVGFESSGLHSNGYTAARHTLLTPNVDPRSEWKSQYRGKYSLSDLVPNTNQTIGQALLEPTLIYSRMIAEIAANSNFVFGVNITGNGLRNFNRFGNDVSFIIEDPFEPKPIHNLVKEEANYDVKTAFTKLNMGMGFAIVLRDNGDAAFEIAKKYNIAAKKIGYVGLASNVNKTILVKDNKSYEFEGY